MPNASENLDNWMKVESNVHSIYPHFLQNLSEKHVTLSEREIKICILTLLKRSATEIKELMGFKEVHAVHSANSRLREKFGMKEDEHLAVYLLKLADAK
jgi:AraC family transcriptional regulator, chitin signaling transcriptional activator